MAKPNGRGGWDLTDDDVIEIMATSFGADYERYCIDSLRPVGMIPGDRCLDHGSAPTMCRTDVRPAQCQHPHLSPNHPQPHCSECGKDVIA